MFWNSLEILVSNWYWGWWSRQNVALDLSLNEEIATDTAPDVTFTLGLRRTFWVIIERSPIKIYIWNPSFANSLGASEQLSLVNMDENTFSVEKNFLRYLILCFRDQQLEPSDLINLAKNWRVSDTPSWRAERLSRCRPDGEEANEKSNHTFGSSSFNFTFQKTSFEHYFMPWMCHQACAFCKPRTYKSLSLACRRVCSLRALLSIRSWV